MLLIKNAFMKIVINNLRTQYCLTLHHKLENLKDVFMKIVINYLFNYGETTADYCFTHKLENMVNVKSKDVFMKIVIKYLILIILKTTGILF
jgi:hypothetical protein